MFIQAEARVLFLHVLNSVHLLAKNEESVIYEIPLKPDYGLSAGSSHLGQCHETPSYSKRHPRQRYVVWRCGCTAAFEPGRQSQPAWRKGHDRLLPHFATARSASDSSPQGILLGLQDPSDSLDAFALWDRRRRGLRLPTLRSAVLAARRAAEPGEQFPICIFFRGRD